MQTQCARQVIMRVIYYYVMYSVWLFGCCTLLSSRLISPVLLARAPRLFRRMYILFECAVQKCDVTRWNFSFHRAKITSASDVVSVTRFFSSCFSSLHRCSYWQFAWGLVPSIQRRAPFSAFLGCWAWRTMRCAKELAVSQGAVRFFFFFFFGTG